MRLFVAIEIDKAVGERIEKTRKELRSEVALPKGAVKWVEPENTHLTLVFLGEAADHRVMEVCRIVEDTAAAHSAFELEVKGLGTFGKPARVVWVGITENPALKALQADLRDAFEKAGWPVENREFSGHLTLCRVKMPSAGDALERKVETLRGKSFGTSWADSMCVFESQLSGGGPVYTVVRNVKMKD
jgi:RNA 2',3'-cyclic 3'-phosphodiesterase